MARVLIIGDMHAELGQAARMAQASGALIAQAEGVSSGLGRLRSEGADLVLCELSHDVAWLVERLQQERIACPVIACGRDVDAEAAVRAVRAGAKDFLPLPPDRRPHRRHARSGGGRAPGSAGPPRPGHGGGAGAGGAARPVGCRHPHHRRERHRQGGAGAARPRPEPARARAVRGAELRGAAGEPAGKRAVRPREGRLHRRDRRPQGQVRAGRRRHLAARRGGRDGPAPPGQAAPRHPGARGGQARRHPPRARRRPHPRRHQPRPDGRGARRPLPGGPVLPPQRGLAPHPGAAGAAGRYRRAGGALRAPASPRPTACRGASCRPRRCRCSCAIPGPAMCGSWRTPCTAPCCWPKGR